MINPAIWLTLMHKGQTPSLSPVTDGLTLWIDGRDGIFDASYNHLTDDTQMQTCYLYDRATNGYFLQQRASVSGLLCSAHDGIFNYVSTNTNAGNQTLAGNIANVKTLDVTFSINHTISPGTTGTNLFLANGTDRFFYRSGATYWYARSLATGYSRVSLASVTTINHYIVTLDGTGVARIYKNGELVATSTATYSALSTTDTIFALSANANVSGQTVAQKVENLIKLKQSYGQELMPEDFKEEQSNELYTNY